MAQKVSDDDAGIPKHLTGKERTDWIKKALGRPVTSEVKGSGVHSISENKSAGGPALDQVYAGKPKHVQ